jgi:GNAT superfamily N-acetyltransferase
MTINVEDITLRPYTSADIPNLIERHQVLYWEEFQYPPDAFGEYVSYELKRLIQSEDTQLWIAEYEPPGTHGNQTSPKVWAGCIAVMPFGEKCGRIRFLLVGSGFRTCGLGRRLVETALDHCRAEGYKKASLTTAGECVAAHRLYSRYGFQRIKVSQDTPWGKYKDEWWEKIL